MIVVRTVLTGNTQVFGEPEDPVGELLAASADWEVLSDPGFERDELLARFEEVVAQARVAGRNRLPTHVDNSIIRRVVAAHAEYKARSIFPLAMSNVLVLFSQLPPGAKHDLRAERITVAVHHGLNAHAVIFAGGDHGRVFTARVRHDDRATLVTATDSLASSLATRSGARGRAGRRPRAVTTTFTTAAQMLEVNGGLVASGAVLTYHGRLQAWTRALLSPIPRALGVVGIALTIVDALLFTLAGGNHNAWAWLDGFTGRLATAAFGAALIAGAEQAIKLRDLLRRSRENASFAAHVDWSAA